MMFTVEDYGSLDGEGMLAVNQKLSATWSEKYERDGWTRAEWMRRSHEESEVRRMPDGIWQLRLTHRERVKALVLIEYELRNKSPSLFLGDSYEQQFDRLVGISWKEWVDGKRECRPDHVDRPWTSLPDEWWPSIETAYQRYIHCG